MALGVLNNVQQLQQPKQKKREKGDLLLQEGPPEQKKEMLHLLRPEDRQVIQRIAHLKV
jgi:hypothetical protein